MQIAINSIARYSEKCTNVYVLIKNTVYTSCSTMEAYKIMFHDLFF